MPENKADYVALAMFLMFLNRFCWEHWDSPAEEYPLPPWYDAHEKLLQDAFPETYPANYNNQP